MPKYIAKVEVNGRTRYFYDKKEYDAYIEGRKDQAEVNNPNAKKKQGSRSMTDNEKRMANARREYAKKTGDYSLGTKLKKNEVKPMTYFRTQKATAAVNNAANDANQRVLDNTREWRQAAAKKGKAFIDKLLQPDK